MIADVPPASGPFLDRINRFLKSLYDADWGDPNGPIRLAEDLTLADVAGAEVFHNTRVFLQALEKDGRTPATATGNLTREFVRRASGDLRRSELLQRTTDQYCQVVNEHDVWPLHMARVLAELGALVVKRKREFVLTKKGRALLPDDHAGALFRQVFLTYFRKLDLRYVAHLRDVPEIQSTMAITLWRLAETAGDWRPVKGIAREILPPRVRERMLDAMVSEYDTEECIVSSYVLNPLHTLGLLEREKESDWPGIGEKDRVRISPLFRRFIAFAPFK
jgi:hypothetical protein